jgi:hypothetical protein
MVLEPLNSYKKHAETLKKAQRDLAGKRKALGIGSRPRKSSQNLP